MPAELVWRWSFGFSALALGLVSIGLFLKSLRVSGTDELMLRTLQPRVLDSALRHILSGSLSRFVLQQVVLLFGMTLLWSLAATAGRAATLQRLVAMFGTEDESQPQEWAFLPIFLLQLARTIWSLTALAVAAGLFIYGTLLAQNQRPLRAALVLSFGVGLTVLAGVLLNWYLGLAPIFCVRSHADSVVALDQAVGFSTRQSGQLLLLATEFFALRLIWAGVMCTMVFSPLSLAASLGIRWAMLLMAAIVLVYFAGADLLRLARLGAWVSLVQEDSRPAPEPEIVPLNEPPIEIMPLEGLA